MPVRLPVVAGLLALGLTVGVVALPVVLHHGGHVGGPGRVFAAGTPTLPPSQPSSSAAVGVLRDWDRRRAAAWADGDAGALRALYTRRSAAGSADVALLQEYAARGLVVRDLRMQLLSVRVLVDRPRQLVLEVTDRVAGATAVRATDRAASRRLPADTATTRVLLLRRVGERWLMARVSSAGR
jgi:hypothetical protein